MERQFTCGHYGAEPAHYGRGKAREERLINYFNRQCYKCALEHQKQFAARLTLVDGTPYTPEQQAGYIARHLIKPY